MQNYDFAIGDISSRRWLSSSSPASVATTGEQSDLAKKSIAGIHLTKPIFLSTLSVLIRKDLLSSLQQAKQDACLANITSARSRSGLGRSSTTTSLSVVSSSYCSSSVTLHDVFDSNQLIRLAIKDGGVHEFYAHHDPSKLGKLILVDRLALFSEGMNMLHNNSYVLVDETKFTQYYADQHGSLFELINVGQGQSLASTSATGVYQEFEGKLYDSDHKARLFRNEIVIALSSKIIDRYQALYGRMLMDEFNMAIDRLDKSGQLKSLQASHWHRMYLARVRANGSGSFKIKMTTIGLDKITLLIIMFAFA